MILFSARVPPTIVSQFAEAGSKSRIISARLEIPYLPHLLPIMSSTSGDWFGGVYKAPILTTLFLFALSSTHKDYILSDP